MIAAPAAFEQIRYHVADRVATITLSRPERLNAFTHEMGQELLAAFDAADADDGVRVVVVTGEGRGFCAGADLSGGNRFDASGLDSPPRDWGGRVSLRILASRKPVIGAINGAAVGVGATMTLPMDIRLASTQARFGFVFARRGIVPEAASSWFLPRLVGISKAMEWVMTGRIFPAAQALSGGLVRSIHEPPDLLPAAYALAAEVAENTSGVSVALARQLLWRMLGPRSPQEAHVADSRAMFATGSAPDAYEGVSSFLDKRPARFPMSVSEELPSLVEQVFGPEPPPWAAQLRDG